MKRALSRRDFLTSGAEFNANGEPVDKWKTPTGDLSTHWKIISLSMISGEGVGVHGAFWHNDFGEQRSHGCINVKPEDTKWIFRWTTPHISLAQSEQRLTWPDHGTIASLTKLEL